MGRGAWEIGTLTEDSQKDCSLGNKGQNLDTKGRERSLPHPHPSPSKISPKGSRVMKAEGRLS